MKFASLHKNRTLTFVSFLLLALSVLMDGAASTPAAQQQHRRPALTLTGSATIDAVPDIAYISSSVVSEAASAEEALALNNTKMQAVFDALATAGIEQRHIKTSNFSLQPRYAQHHPRPGEIQRAPEIIGYSVENTLTVKVVNLATLGKTITEVVKFGSNQLGNIYFDVSNKEQLLDEARTKAVMDAKRKAAIYTSAAGVKIGRLLSLSEGNTPPSYPRPQVFARTAALEDAPTPISGGELQIAFTVSMKWEIEQ